MMYNNKCKQRVAAPLPPLPPRFNRNNNPSPINYGYNWDAVPNVLLYIDNSNIFESAKKYSGRKKGYRNGIPDVACRIDIGKLISKAVGTRKLLFGKLYGSEPPALDTVWDAIRKKHVQVETFQRSKWTFKEKECDASLTADAVEDLIMQKDKAGENRTVVIFSGDRDLFRLVDKAVKFGYRVEIWSFKSSMNNTVIRSAKENPDQIQIHNIDDIFEEITFTKVVWGDQKIPRERSILATVSLSEESDKRHILKTFVGKAGAIFQLPMMGKYIDNYQHILLVPCIKEHYTPPVNQTRPKQATVRTYDFYTHIQPFIHILQEHFTDFCSSIITWNEFLTNRHELVNQHILSSTRFQLLQNSDEEEEVDDQEDLESGIHMSDDTDSEDLDSLDFFDAHHDNLTDDFIPLVRKITKTKRNIYSDPCIHKFWCTSGLNCAYKHTDQQREFFKLHHDTKLRRCYKIKPCYHTVCQYYDKSYLCPYAHSLQESRCLCCGGKGNGIHWMHKCPLNTNMNKN